MSVILKIVKVYIILTTYFHIKFAATNRLHHIIFQSNLFIGMSCFADYFRRPCNMYNHPFPVPWSVIKRINMAVFYAASQFIAEELC